MIHSLCDKLKQNNSKLLMNVNIKEKSNNNNQVKENSKSRKT